MANKRNLHLTPTGAYFHEVSADSARDVSTASWYVPEHREPFPPLSWHIDHEKRDATAEGIARQLDLAVMPHTLFFIDTNFYSNPVDDAIWYALAKRDVVIPPLIRMELQPWIDKGTTNDAMRRRVRAAVNSGGQRIHFDDIDEVLKAHAYSYYETLLALRRVEGRGIALKMSQELGREPTNDEFSRVAQPKLGDRGQRIARKGWKEWGKSNYLADEQLVIMAFLTALLSGNYVIILTRDHDIMEQFGKLHYLIDHHYRAMLLADMISRNPEAHEKKFLRDLPGRFPPRFVGEDDYLVDSNLPKSWDDLPSSDPRTVTIECWWFGDGPSQLKVAAMQYCAKMEMKRLLEIKARTGGLNTDKLAGKNCHIRPILKGEGDSGRWGAIVEDRLGDVSLLDAVVAEHDALMALQSQERYSEIRFAWKPSWGSQ
jgi:hypothetical protein